MKSIKKKGIKFHTTIEDLVTIQLWHKAKENGWLINRNERLIEIDTNILASNIVLNEETLLALGFTTDESLLITHKVDDNHKKKFTNLVCETPDSLIAIKYQFDEILEKLKISN